MSCKNCIRELRIDSSLTHPPLQIPNEHLTAPDDAIQKNLVPEIPPSGANESILTATNVSPNISLHTRHLIKTPKLSLKL